MQNNEAIAANPISMTNGDEPARPSPVLVPSVPLAATSATSTSPTISSSTGSSSSTAPSASGGATNVLTSGLPAPTAPYLTITNPAMTAAVLSQQPLIIPTGAQFLTIPVSLATLPGSNQIPVFATSTGQLVLANLASVPTPGSNYNASNHGASSTTSPFTVNPPPFVTQAAQLSRPPPGIPGMPISIHAINNQSNIATSALSVNSASGISDGHKVDIDRDDVKECVNSEEVEEEVEDDVDDEEGGHSSSPASISENKICNILNDTGSGDEGLSPDDLIALASRRSGLGGETSGKVVVDGIDLEEIREFARQFKIRRLSLGLTQSQVGQALTAAEGPAYSQSAICRFEKLDITPKSAQKIKPVLEKWMQEAEQRYQEGMRDTGGSNLASDLTKKRKRRTSFTPQALDVLNAHFDKNTHPSGAEMTALAEQLKYDREVVRVWFCNKRQALKNTIKRLKTDQQMQLNQSVVNAATTHSLSRQLSQQHQQPLPTLPPPATAASQQLQLQPKQATPPLPSAAPQQQRPQPDQSLQRPQQRQPLPQLQLQLPTQSTLANRVLAQSATGLCNLPMDDLKTKVAKLEASSPMPSDLIEADPAGMTSTVTSNQHLNHEPDSSVANEACSLPTKVEADPV